MNNKKIIKPHFDCILCVDYDYEHTTKSGLVLPTKENYETSKYVKIVSKGNNVKTVDVGDILLIDKSNGFLIEHDNIKYRMIRESQIIATLQNYES